MEKDEREKEEEEKMERGKDGGRSDEIHYKGQCVHFFV